MNKIQIKSDLKVGQKSTDKPGYYVWPDGVERPSVVPRGLSPRLTLIGIFIDWHARR